MSALIETLECAPTAKPYEQIEFMGRRAKRDEVLVCATINGVFVTVGWEENSVQAAKDKYDRDYRRLPENRKRLSIVTHTASVWPLFLFACAFALAMKGVLA